MQTNESMTTPCEARDDLSFPARTGERQEDVSILIFELAIPPWRDLYGKNHLYSTIGIPKIVADIKAHKVFGQRNLATADLDMHKVTRIKVLKQAKAAQLNFKKAVKIN